MESNQSLALKRLQSMRKTAMDKTVYYENNGQPQRAYWWRSQYYALDQAVMIVIDPTQLTIMDEDSEKILG